MKHEHIQEAARDAKQMEESSILGGDPLMETCTCTRVETEFSQMCDYCQALEKKHPGYFAGLEPSWTGTNSREGDGHDNDCATHDAPAYPKGECDCSVQDDATQENPWRAHIYAVMEGGSYFGAQDWNDLLAYMASEHKKIINLGDQVKQLSSMVRQYETALIIKNEEHGCCAEDLIDARKDSERLDWLMRNVSGKEFRRLGVTYGGNCGRDRIDAAMKVSAGDTARPPTPTGWSDTDWLKHLQEQQPAGRAAHQPREHGCSGGCLRG